MKIVLAELWDFFKINFKWLLVVGIGFILFTRGCFNPSAPPKSDESKTTTYVPQPIIVNPPYQPTQSGSTVYVPIPSNSQPLTPATDIATLTQQVLQLNTRIETLAKEYYAIKHYDDSIQLKDTAGTRVGVMNLKQTVSENTLKETIPSYQLSFPQTTIIKTAPPRNQVYIGGGFQPQINYNSFTQASIGLQFKNKTNHMIGVYGTYNFQAKQPGLGFTYYKLLTLRK